jgi:hypothetical protein
LRLNEGSKFIRKVSMRERASSYSVTTFQP